MKREEGFYWIKYRGRWIVAEWSGYYWWMPMSDSAWIDSELEEIDPTPIKHNRV